MTDKAKDLRFQESAEHKDGGAGASQRGAPVDEDAEDQLVEEELIEAIENQLSAQQPAATQAVLNKLTLVGHTREEAVQMMAQVLAWQVSEMLKADCAFDMAAYERALRALPNMPEAS